MKGGGPESSSSSNMELINKPFVLAYQFLDFKEMLALQNEKDPYQVTSLSYLSQLAHPKSLDEPSFLQKWRKNLLDFSLGKGDIFTLFLGGTVPYMDINTGQFHHTSFPMEPLGSFSLEGRRRSNAPPGMLAAFNLPYSGGGKMSSQFYQKYGLMVENDQVFADEKPLFFGRIQRDVSGKPYIYGVESDDPSSRLPLFNYGKQMAICPFLEQGTSSRFI